METFEILITSPPDREKVVAEIWLENNLIAEINQENEVCEIEIYQKERLVFPFDDFYLALGDALNKLKQG
jgi:uncharacterized protein YuzE